MACLILAGFGVERSLDYKVNTSIKREAEQKAVRWAANLVAQLPSIERIMRTGKATPEEAQRIRDAIAVGEVFRFKLFTPSGHLTFVSDEARFLQERGWQINRTARNVFETGQVNISVFDGRTKPNRPDYYVEAYIPAIGQDGRRIGVIEVYVDVTAIHYVLSSAFSALSFWLIAGCALVFVTPAAAIMWRGRQLQLRDRRVAALQRFDHLTGVLNRNTLSQELSKVFAERAPDESLGLLFIDVDHFKQINDSLGHQAGDALLKIVAKALKDCTRSDGDIVGRFGGDEFVCAYRSMDREQVRTMVQRIQIMLTQVSEEVGVALTPTLSIGAHLSCPGETEQDALRAADVAVYEAKRRGRNQMVEYTHELDANRQRELHVERLLRSATVDGLLTLHFQPIFGTVGRRLLGFEALLRLRDPEGGMISPAEFIPIAEQSQLMEEIGDWVLWQALEVAQRWPNHLFVSINISVTQFKSGTLPDKVLEALEKQRFDPARLELEITETLLIQNEHDVWQQLRRLRSCGVRVAIDDFGAGNTSIGHFWRFNVDKLKLDRGFLASYDNESEFYRQLLHGICAFAKSINLTVVAEGIEHEDQLGINAETGVDQVQGFLLGRPMPAEDAACFAQLEQRPQACAA